MNFTIGDKVKKISGKPFKSTKKINTIKGFCINEQDPKQRLSATFEEDTSVVTLDHIEVVSSALNSMSLFKSFLYMIRFFLWCGISVIWITIYFLLCPYLNEDDTFRVDANELSHFNQFL